MGIPAPTFQHGFDPGQEIAEALELGEGEAAEDAGLLVRIDVVVLDRHLAFFVLHQQGRFGAAVQRRGDLFRVRLLPDAVVLPRQQDEDLLVGQDHFFADHEQEHHKA